MLAFYQDYYSYIGWNRDHPVDGRYIPKRSTIIKNKRRRKR